jgi:hypothetical protein
MVISWYRLNTPVTFPGGNVKQSTENGGKANRLHNFLTGPPVYYIAVSLL